MTDAKDAAPPAGPVEFLGAFLADLLRHFDLAERVTVVSSAMGIIVSDVGLVSRLGANRHATQPVLRWADERVCIELGLHTIALDGAYDEDQSLRALADWLAAWFAGQLWAQQEVVDGRVLRSKMMFRPGATRGSATTSAACCVAEAAGDARWTDAFRRKTVVDLRSVVTWTAPPADETLARPPWAPWTGHAGLGVMAIVDAYASASSDDSGVVLSTDGELDLHNFHPREVKRLVLAYIESCRAEGQLQLRIVHGKGKGVLRRRVHEILEQHEAVRHFELGGSGGGSWGATIVDLHALD